jgi:putative DNA primase/helicase
MRFDELETEPLTTPPDLTEDGLALELTRRHRDELLYVHEWRRWLRWDGRRWAFERTLAIYDLARKLVHGLEIGDKKLRARIMGAATIHAIVSLARADRAHARVPEDFDADHGSSTRPRERSSSGPV